jgi:type IV secretion system protein VirB9
MRIVIYLLTSIFSIFSTSIANQGIYSQVKQSEPTFKRIVVEPRQLGHDPRFKTFSFTPNTTYKIVTVYDNPSFIEFDVNEGVTTIVNPKKTAWQLLSSGNRLFIKPEESDADTQITVMTNKRIYFFEMYAKEPDSNFDKDYSFFFKFKYPSEEESKTIRTYAKSILPDVDQNPWKYNFNYTITGEDSLYPVKIFDDGEFTYFEFPRTAKMPAIFAVDSNGFESIVNFRIVGEYLIVEEVSTRFTLRNGAEIVCVFNENMYKPKNSKRQKKRDYSYEIEQYNNEERNTQDSMIYN